MIIITRADGKDHNNWMCIFDANISIPVQKIKLQEQMVKIIITGCAPFKLGGH